MADNAEATAPIDTDGDNIGDFLEIDSDGDGCTDLVEAGYSDGEGDGILGSNPVTVNEVGKVTSGTDGYTNPLDNDGKAVLASNNGCHHPINYRTEDWVSQVKMMD